MLDEATSRAAAGRTSIASRCHGDALVASAGDGVFVLGADGAWTRRSDPIGRRSPAWPRSGRTASPSRWRPARSSSRAAASTGAAIAPAPSVSCITAMAGIGTELYVANGSATNGAADWQRDLLERNASGSIWRIDLESGTSAARLADGLAWPAGLAVDADGLVFSEAWKHQLVQDRPRPARQAAGAATPTCRPIPAGSRPPRMATGWRCLRRAASSSSSCCASRPTASA